MRTQSVTFRSLSSLFVTFSLLLSDTGGFAQVAREPASSLSEDSTETNPRNALPAPTGFDLQTNGFVDQATMDEARLDFTEIETPEDGLGPVFNDVACAACHQSPSTGGGSNVLELR